MLEPKRRWVDSYRFRYGFLAVFKHGPRIASRRPCKCVLILIDALALCEDRVGLSSPVVSPLRSSWRIALYIPLLQRHPFESLHARQGQRGCESERGGLWAREGGNSRVCRGNHSRRRFVDYELYLRSACTRSVCRSWRMHTDANPRILLFGWHAKHRRHAADCRTGRAFHRYAPPNFLPKENEANMASMMP